MIFYLEYIIGWFDNINDFFVIYFAAVGNRSPFSHVWSWKAIGELGVYFIFMKDDKVFYSNTFFSVLCYIMPTCWSYQEQIIFLDRLFLMRLTNSFVCFLGEVLAQQFWFEIYWPLVAISLKIAFNFEECFTSCKLRKSAEDNATVESAIPPKAAAELPNRWRQLLFLLEFFEN